MLASQNNLLVSRIEANTNLMSRIVSDDQLLVSFDY